MLPQNALHVVVRVAQTRGQHLDEGGDTATDAANREVDIEDVEETDLGVLTAGEEEPEIESEAENNDRQQTDCQHQQDDWARMRACYEQLGPA